MKRLFTASHRPLAATSILRVLKAAGLLLALLAIPVGRAWATIYVVANPDKRNNYSLNTGDVLTINSNVDFRGTITVQGNNVAITNNGEITSDATLTVNSSASGTVINNFGTVPCQTVYLNAITTINNGSASVNSGVSWTGYVGSRFTMAPIINNYASWTAQIQPLPGGTITNYANATWNAYMTLTANLSITNSGNWQSQIQEGSSTLTIVHNAGNWTGGLGDGSGSLRITNNATWTKGFNFSSGSNNAFTTAAGATTTFGSYVGTGGQVAITNNGSMAFNGGMGSLGTGSSMTNAAGQTLTLQGDLTSNGTLTNSGTLNVSGNFTISGGTFTNTGTANTGQFTNSATVANRGAVVVGNNGNFTNSGTITGTSTLPRATFRAAASTTNSGNFGADGSYLDFCDATPPSPATNGFDSRAGTIGPNVTYCASAAPLPVELTVFTALAAKGKVRLQWATAMERNSAAFVVERSASGEGFSAVAEIKAQGNSTQATVYAAIDAKPLAGKSYYRLRMVDLDGTTAYSQVQKVDAGALSQSLDFYPNPAADHLTLDLRPAPAAPCEVRILSLTGQVLLKATLVGGQLRELPLAGVPAGLYLLQVRSAQGSTVQRMEKL
ncbi:T9SS type A sorting domain-containing protein [Hymenobacter sp. M29]|uniref:T9SS type A sorting domain-containing protein n=1 Tax=Hymenobacter mellowenesis TaxID=3063995 RepID=A0ABT9AF00_9BACT|nr:T9SS type A sorting domain-containing protein [Hymenobacter sp. M29]MDO7848438.1 T9SS type A sorting domain-containing protein [Hymenobacter sp. M29]